MMDTQEIVKTRAFQLVIEMAADSVIRSYSGGVIEFLGLVAKVWNDLDAAIQYRVFEKVVVSKYGLNSNLWRDDQREAIKAFARMAYGSLPREVKDWVELVYRGKLPWEEMK